MTIKCAVIDDEPLALEMMASYVKRTPFLELVAAYPNAVEAMQNLPDTEVDLLFVDIQMPELDGIEFSKLVGDRAKVIFTTAFAEYALEGYRVSALDYLLKPISYTSFLEAAGKAREWFGRTTRHSATASASADAESIFVKSEYKLIRLFYSDILYIEGLKDYVKIYTESQPRAILSLATMKTLEDILPTGRFCRVHRSYIVNMSRVSVIERGQIVFGDKHLPISDTYKKTVQDYLDKLTLPGRGVTL